MRETIRVYLVPGFFGFTNFGELKYFAHVKEALERSFADRGVKAFVERVKTSPTASLPVRTGMLLHEIAATARDDLLPIHLVGHSTGGLDARLLVGPAFGATADDEARKIIDRVRSVLCVATPHYGSPLAAFFDGAFGAQLLKLLSLATILVLRTGKIPVGALTLLAGVVTRVDELLGAKPDVLDQLYDLLLADFSLDRRRELERHFLAVGKDRALIAQLSPEAMQVFNATTPDRASVRYGCVATQAEKPTILSTVSQGLSPYAQASHALYHALWHTGARGDLSAAPPLSPQHAHEFTVELGAPPTEKSNDGIVPTLSQLRGELIHAVAADHLDVIGHFDDPQHAPPHYDWIHSGSGFRRHHFDGLWRAVASFILRDGAAS